MSNVIVNTSQSYVNITSSDVDGNLITNTVVADNMPQIQIVDTNSQSMSRLIGGSAPQSSVEAGQPGEIRWDSNYLYLCVSANRWKKVTLLEL